MSEVELLRRLQKKFRELEEDLHNRARYVEKKVNDIEQRLDTIEKYGDELDDRVELIETEMLILKERLK